MKKELLLAITLFASCGAFNKSKSSKGNKKQELNTEVPSNGTTLPEETPSNGNGNMEGESLETVWNENRPQIQYSIFSEEKIKTVDFSKHINLNNQSIVSYEIKHDCGFLQISKGGVLSGTVKHVNEIEICNVDVSASIKEQSNTTDKITYQLEINPHFCKNSELAGFVLQEGLQSQIDVNRNIEDLILLSSQKVKPEELLIKSREYVGFPLNQTFLGLLSNCDDLKDRRKEIRKVAFSIFNYKNIDIISRYIKYFPNIQEFQFTFLNSQLGAEEALKAGEKLGKLVKELERMSFLEKIKFTSMEKIDIDFHGKMDSLNSLTISGFSVGSLPLLNNLKELSLEDNNYYKTIEFPASLEALYLNIEEKSQFEPNEISQINNMLTGLSRLENLRRLSLYVDSWDVNVENIKNNKQLETLIVKFAKIKNLESISQLKKIKHLGLIVHETGSLMPLLELPELIYLDISLNRSDQVYVLPLLENIIVLNASVTDIVNIKPLEIMTQLISLDLALNTINDISSLSKLINLRFLDIAHNNIKNFTPLVALHKLEELKILSNEVEEVVCPIGSNNDLVNDTCQHYINFLEN